MLRHWSNNILFFWRNKGGEVVQILKIESETFETIPVKTDQMFFGDFPAVWRQVRNVFFPFYIVAQHVVWSVILPPCDLWPLILCWHITGWEAAAAGLQPGQVILKVNGNNVNHSDYQEVLEHFSVQQTHQEPPKVVRRHMKTNNETQTGEVLVKVECVSDSYNYICVSLATLLHWAGWFIIFWLILSCTFVSPVPKTTQSSFI